MRFIKINNHVRFLNRSSVLSIEMTNKPVFSCPIPELFSAFFFIVTLFVSPATAAVKDVSIESIGQIIVDDDGNRLNYPSSVFFDPVEEEIYVVNAGAGRVVVYGADFFPRNSIGTGRGIIAPRSGTVLNNGDVYICQIENTKDSPNRISILNGAFFIKREIILDEIPEFQGFSSTNIAVNTEGDMYLSGDTGYGVLVLDDQGKFLRHLQPKDKVGHLSFRRWEESGEKDNESDVDYENIPEEFRPRKYNLGERTAASDGLWPVRINDIKIDSTGRLYLVSFETSKIYVYDYFENFIFSFGVKGGTPGKLSQPKSLAIDEARGIIYVADYMRHTILAYNMFGEFLFEFGGRGWEPGSLNYPTELAVNNNGQVIVSDLFNRRVQVLEVDYGDILPFIKDKLSPISSPGHIQNVEPDVFALGRIGETLPSDSSKDN